jgi:hypothetical protein
LTPRRLAPIIQTVARARLWIAATFVATLGCRTTHQLGKVSPATVQVLRDAGEERGAAYVQIEPLPVERSAGVSQRIRGIDVQGVSLEVSGPPVVVPFVHVGFISTYDHARGAQRGAVIGGLTGLVLISAVTLYFEHVADIAARDGGGGGPQASAVVLGIAGGTAVGALVGAGIGAAAGYEDRYLVMH